jgi:hypothetical protein
MKVGDPGGWLEFATIAGHELNASNKTEIHGPCGRLRCLQSTEFYWMRKVISYSVCSPRAYTCTPISQYRDSQERHRLARISTFIITTFITKGVDHR